MSLKKLLQSSQGGKRTLIRRGDVSAQSNLASAATIPHYIHMTSTCYDEGIKYNGGQELTWQH